MDRKNKHCRRPEDHQSTGVFGEDERFSHEVEFGTPETHCSRLPSRKTLIRQYACFTKAVPKAYVHNPTKSRGEPL